MPTNPTSNRDLLQPLNLNPDIEGITLDQMLREVGRELGLRRSRYPQWVQRRQMTIDEANSRIACMSALYAKLKRELQQPQPDTLAQDLEASLRVPV